MICHRQTCGKNVAFEQFATGGEQVKLSISEAARRARVDRSALYRKIKLGQISKEIGADGKPVVDLSELARVYPYVVAGEVPQVNSTSNSETNSLPQATLQAENAVLRQRIAALEADKADLRGERDKLLEVVQSTTRLIADQRPSARKKWLGIF